MESKNNIRILALLLCALFTVTSCAPITEESRPTGKNTIGALGGGAIGAGATAAFNAPAPVVGVAGVAGAALGYYLTTERFSAGGVLKAGGKVYTVGQFLTIEIPSDNLFDANTAEFLDNTEPMLDSVASTLKRYPNHNLIISGNTSGYGTSTFEQKLSVARAEQVASYLWLHGITDKLPNLVTGKKRRLIYVGYGNNFPIANTIHINSIRANSRIQIVAYPDDEVLHWDKVHKNFKLFDNIGEPDQIVSEPVPANRNYADAFGGDPVSGKTAPKPPAVGYVPPPVRNYVTTNNDTLKNDLNALPTPNEKPVPDLIPALRAKLEPMPANQPAPVTAQKSVSSEPQTLVEVNTKKHWGSKDDNALKDETPPALPSPDPDALPAAIK